MFTLDELKVNRNLGEEFPEYGFDAGHHRCAEYHRSDFEDYPDRYPPVSFRTGTKLQQRNRDQRTMDLRAWDLAADPLLFQKVSEVYKALLESCCGLNREAIEYLKMQGISEETAKKFGLAYISDYAMASDFLFRRFPRELLEWTGLLSAKKNLKFYMHKLLFPYVMDRRVVFLQGRTLDSQITPKEINLDRPCPCPFNANAARIEGVERVYLCEGVINTLILIERGLPAVGIPGCGSFKRNWVEFFRGKNVLICFDSDNPGQSVANHVHDLFARAKIESRIIVLPSGEDVNSYLEVLHQFEVE
jgi:DNA primase